MSQVGRFLFLVGCMFAYMLPGNIVHAASLTLTGIYPATTVPVGATITFGVVPQGFTNPTFEILDSFPGGVTSSRIDSAGNFSWTPNGSQIGAHSLTITVTDSLDNSASIIQDLRVEGPARVTIDSLSQGGNAGQPVSFSVSTYGFLNPTLSVKDSFYNSSLQPYNLGSSGNFYWTPIGQDIGTHTITVTANDLYENTATASIDIAIKSGRETEETAGSATSTPPPPPPPASQSSVPAAPGPGSTPKSTPKQSKPSSTSTPAQSVEKDFPKTIVTAATSSGMPDILVAHDIDVAPLRDVSFGEFLMGSVVGFFSSLLHLLPFF